MGGAYSLEKGERGKSSDKRRKIGQLSRIHLFA
jgi:hypothetical protein